MTLPRRRGRVRRSAEFRAEVFYLEERTLLSTGRNTFAQFDGAVTGPSGSGVTEVRVTPADFNSPRGRVLLGFSAEADSAGLAPGRIRIVPHRGARSSAILGKTNSAGDHSSLTLATAKPGDYSLRVGSRRDTSGSYRLATFLAGDANGDFRVDTADLRLIRSLRGVRAGDPRYLLDADVNRNGVIGDYDLVLARANRGVSTRLRPLSPTIGLDAGTPRDTQGRVTSPAVTLVGQSAPGSSVGLDLGADGTLDRTTTADASGHYGFTIAPPIGTTTLLALASDTFGQHATARLTFDRVATPANPPNNTPANPPDTPPNNPPTNLATTAPTITLNTPAPTSAVRTPPTITGTILDATSPVATLTARVNSAASVPVSFDASTGAFTFTPTVPHDGPYAVVFTGTDAAGDKALSPVFLFQLDTTAPTATASLSGTVNATISGLDVTFSEPVSGLAALPENYTLQPASGAPFHPSAATLTAPNVAHLAFSSPLANGAYRLALSSAITDLAGNPVSESTASFAFTVAVPVQITQTTPANGEEDVSEARTIVVNFDAPVDPSTLTPDAFQAIALGAPIAGTIRVSSTKMFATLVPTAALPASTEVRILVDGNKVKGLDGLPIDANGDGAPGGMLSADFTTLSLTQVPGTNVYGYVYDSYHKNPDGSNIPIVGATIRVDAFPSLNAVTDSNGYFLLKDLPAPSIFVHVDGTTATSAPSGFGYPSVGKEFMDVPGQTIQLTMDSDQDVNPDQPGDQFHIYLPPMAMGDLRPLSTSEATTVGFGAAGKAELANLLPGVDPSVFDEVQVTYPAGSAIDRNGNPAAMGAIIPVPPDRLPAPLPPGQNPKLVISIQALGADGQPLTNPSFDQPAQVAFPNLEGLAPGEKSLIWSFNHDKGMWEVVGTGTVSADGKLIVSDGGVIRAPGWHFTASGALYADVANYNKVGSKLDYNDPAKLKAEYPIWDANPAALATFAGLAELDITTAIGVFSLSAPNAATLLNHYNANSGDDLYFPDGSGLSNELKNDPSFKQDNDVNNNNSVQHRLKEAIKAQLSSDSGEVDFEAAISLVAADAFNTSGFLDELSDLHLALGKIQAVTLKGEGDIEGSGNDRAVGNLVYNYSIIYGFGVADKSRVFPVGLIGQEARLRQLAGLARPFTVNVQVNVPFDLDLGVDPADGVLPHLPVSQAPGFGNDPSVYYRFTLDSGFQIAGKTDSLGQISNLSLPPNAGYRAVFYAPASNRWTSFIGTSGASGSAFGEGDTPSTLDLMEFGGVDADADGIPDIGEYAIGTDPNKADTNGDGISDSASLVEGLNPLGSSAFPTGDIANLTLPGSAEAIAVANDFAYIATGGHGLAIVNGSKFNKPILQGQLDLGGSPSGVGVDPNLKVAAVATGTALALVDVSDPMTPKLNQKVSVGATKVVVVDGFAFATSGTSLSIVNMQTGDVIDRVTLPGSGDVTGVAIDGTHLYAFVSGSDTVAVVDISSPEAAAVVGRTNVSVASTDVGIFAGDGTVWLSGSGLRTVDVRDPSKPKEIHDADFTFTSRRIALNGSGLGLLIPDGGGFVQLYDTSDPTRTNQLLTQFPLASGARSVAISRGIGYIGTANGLEVVNYEPFDSKGVAPAVTISASPPDADSTNDGVQALEGTTIPIQVAVSDDVQVRDVALLVNGIQVADAVNYPFNLAAAVPTLASGATSLTIQVRATDTGGNSTFSNLLTYGISPDRTPPTITRISPSDGSTRFAGGKSVLVRFSEPIVASGPLGDDFRLVEAGPDGTLGTADDVTVSATISLSDNNQLAQIVTNDPIDVGAYQVQVEGAAVADRAGNLLGSGTFTSGFTVIARPTIDNLFDLSGTPVSGSLTLQSPEIKVGIDSDGSFITDDKATGLVFAGVDFLSPGDPLAGFTVAHDGKNFTNDRPAYQGQSQIAVTIQDLSSGSFHGVRIEGVVDGVLKLERVIAFNDGDQFITVATRLTNLTDATLSDVASLENDDPDQGTPIGVGAKTNNDVVEGGRLVIASVTNATFPAGLTIGLGSEDSRATVSAEQFYVTNPFNIIDSPVDPDGAASDSAINLAFNFGDLAAGDSVSAAFVVALGHSSDEAEAIYDSASPETDGPGGPH